MNLVCRSAYRTGVNIHVEIPLDGTRHEAGESGRMLGYRGRNEKYLAPWGLAQGERNGQSGSADSDGKPNRLAHAGDVARQHFGTELVRRETKVCLNLAGAADHDAE